MTFPMLLISTLIASALSVAFGFWWRGRIDRALPTTTVAPTENGAFAVVDIQLFGEHVKTDMRVDLQQMEVLANSMGKTLSDLPSTMRH
jgi:hypothetical protein